MFIGLLGMILVNGFGLPSMFSWWKTNKQTNIEKLILAEIHDGDIHFNMAETNIYTKHRL